MTLFRRLPGRRAAAVALGCGLFAGCANQSQFTAGRMPYGGGELASASSASRQDPFLAQAEEARQAEGAPADGRYAAGPRVAQGGRPQYSLQEYSYRGGQGQQGEFGAPGEFAPASQMPAGNMPTGQMARQTPGGSNSYQAAYRQAQNPFDPPAAPPAGPVQPAGYQAPAAETNPFAEIEGQSAASAGSIRQTSATAEPLPQIVPAGGTRESWSSGQTTTAAFESEEFLPPVR